MLPVALYFIIIIIILYYYCYETRCFDCCSEKKNVQGTFCNVICQTLERKGDLTTFST